MCTALIEETEYFFTKCSKLNLSSTFHFAASFFFITGMKTDYVLYKCITKLNVYDTLSRTESSFIRCSKFYLTSIFQIGSFLFFITWLKTMSHESVLHEFKFNGALRRVCLLRLHFRKMQL